MKVMKRHGPGGRGRGYRSCEAEEGKTCTLKGRPTWSGDIMNEKGAGSCDNIAESSHDFRHSGKHIQTLDDLLRTLRPPV